MLYVYGGPCINIICYDEYMIAINEIVKPNIILIRALSDSPNLSIELRATLRKLASLGKNPAKISKIDVGDGITLKLVAQDSYSSIPAVMCEGYNGGEGVSCHFETQDQAEMLFTAENTIKLTNVSQDIIESQQLVKLVYNNKNLVVMPVEKVSSIRDYHGVIGKAVSNILQYQTGAVKLINISQAMDLKSFHKLTIKNFGG